MAFQKQYENEEGFTAPTAYFRVIDVKANWQDQRAFVTVAIFKDAAARNANKNPMGYQKFTIGPYATPKTGITFDELFGIETLGQANNNPVKSVYSWLMNRPENSGAVPV